LNQLLTFLVIAAYCAEGAYVTWTGPNPIEAAIRAQPELAEVLGGDGQGASFDELNEWSRRTAMAMYGAVAAGSLVVQGLTAALYLSLGSTLAARIRRGGTRRRRGRPAAARRSDSPTGGRRRPHPDARRPRPGSRAPGHSVHCRRCRRDGARWPG
jgi:hypothetical protein